MASVPKSPPSAYPSQGISLSLSPPTTTSAILYSRLLHLPGLSVLPLCPLPCFLSAPTLAPPCLRPPPSLPQAFPLCLLPPFRYFTPGFMLLMLHMRPPSNLQLLVTLSLYAAVDAATLYIFLEKTFEWSDGTTARFMW